MAFFLKSHILILTLNCVNLARCTRETDYTNDYGEDDINYYLENEYDVAEEEDLEHKEMPEDCKILQYYVLRRQCNDLYPEDVSEIYHDPFVTAHDQYAVFHFKDHDGVKNYFLTFSHSELFHCEEILVKDVINFICTNASGTTHDIKLKSGYMQCLTYKSDMVDELLTACSPNLNKSSKFTALHYANILASLRSDCNVNTMLYRSLLLGLVTLVISFEYLKLISLL